MGPAEDGAAGFCCCQSIIDSLALGATLRASGPAHTEQLSSPIQYKSTSSVSGDVSCFRWSQEEEEEEEGPLPPTSATAEVKGAHGRAWVM